MNIFRQHFGIALGLMDALVPEHFADVLNLHIVAQHLRGEGMTSQVGVHPRGDASHQSKRFEMAVVVGIVHFWNFHTVFLQNANNGWQQVGHERHTSLDAFAGVRPLGAIEFVLLDIECLHVGVGEARVQLNDEEIAGRGEWRTFWKL